MTTEEMCLILVEKTLKLCDKLEVENARLERDNASAMKLLTLEQKLNADLMGKDAMEGEL